MTENEALRRFFIFTYHEAAVALAHHRARARGGQHVGVARMPLTVCERIVRDAQQLGLDLDHTGPDLDRVVFTDRDGPGDAPTLSAS